MAGDIKSYRDLLVWQKAMSLVLASLVNKLGQEPRKG